MRIALTLDSMSAPVNLELMALEEGAPARPGGRYELVVRHGYRPEARHAIEPSEAESILALIRDSRLPPLAARPELGLDGVTYTLSLSSFMSHSTYQWWCQAPEEWEALGHLAQHMLSLARKYSTEGYFPG